MKLACTVAVLAILVPSLASAQALTTQGKSFGVIAKDEGTVLGGATAVNCSGAGVTCTESAGVMTFSIPGGSGNLFFVTVDFGSSGSFDAQTVVTGQAWVSASSTILCTATANSTATRAADVDDAWIENFTPTISKRVAGTGFTLNVRPDNGEALGQFVFACTGG